MNNLHVTMSSKQYQTPFVYICLIMFCTIIVFRARYIVYSYNIHINIRIYVHLFTYIYTYVYINIVNSHRTPVRRSPA